MMIRKKMWGVFIAAALAVVAVVLYLNLPPAKITDPNDPRFDPMQFRFEDYAYFSGEVELADVFRILFPPGIEKSDVDKILIWSGRATIYHAHREQNKYKVICYLEPDKWYFLKGRPSHYFVYDEGERLVNIHEGKGFALYPHQPSYEGALFREDFQEERVQ